MTPPRRRPRSRAVWASLCAIALTLLAIGCGPGIGDPKFIDGIPHVYRGRVDERDIWEPAWVDAPQAHATGDIAAVGMYGPTRYRETGRKRLIEAGVQQLGRAVSVRVRSAVQSLALDRAELFSGSDASSLFVKTMAEQTSDVKLTGVVVERTWQHPVTGMNYALVSVGGPNVQDAVKLVGRRVARENRDVFVPRRVDDALRELDRVIERGLTDTR